jgi:hypothetical protein
MKLIKEINEEINVLCEEKNGRKYYFIEGVWLQANIKNRNGRMYPMPVLEREVKRYTEQYIDKKRAFGELGHPDSPTINLDRVSHNIVSLRKEGDNFIGKAKILDTPNGKIVQAFLDEGLTIGVSSRGLGSLKTTSEGLNIVQDDYYLATGGDIVADPSAPDAFVQGILENKEWILTAEGVWIPQFIESVKKELETKSATEINRKKEAFLEEFLKKLGGN